MRGYEERTRAAKAALEITDPDSIDKYVFYNAVLITIGAVRRWANRYAALATEQVAECVEVMRLGFGMPALNNDEVIIPSFLT